ncbi:MAG TPA: VTT domain-containing protein [Rhodanobacteraceae bacterium]|nr:VTT domain-containing protein [Rhodanobacteraceae bacterium]
MTRLRAFVPLLILIAIGVAVGASGMLQSLAPSHIMLEQANWSRQIAAHPALAYFVYVVVLTLSVATAMPGPLLIIIAGGMLFGMGPAIGLSLVGEVLGSLLLYYAARHAFGYGKRPPPKFVERIRQGYQANPVSYTLFLRFVPLFPFGGVTVALAWLRCPVWLFAIATTFGGVIMLVFETAIGAGVGQSIAEGKGLSPGIIMEPHIWLPLVGLGLLALIPVLLQRMRAAESAE